jgi:hypothetical protein
MKIILFVLGILILSNFAFAQFPKATVKLVSTSFNIEIPDVGIDPLSGQGYGSGLSESVSGSLMFTKNGVEHIIGNGAYSNKGLPPIHFINKNNSDSWKFENYYSNVAMGNARNYVFIDSSNIAIADHGLEKGNPWPFGDIWTIKSKNDSLTWTKISKYKSFYHSVAVGDINSDGRNDLIGLHLGSYNPWIGNNQLHPYIQNSDSSFREGTNLIKDLDSLYGAGSVLIADIMGDSRPEIIQGQYGSGFSPYAFQIYGYDSLINKYVVKKRPKSTGIFSDGLQGSTSIKLADFNKDGIKDLAIASEGYPNTMIQIWNGQGDGEFSPGQILNYPDVKPTGFPDSSNTFREFEIADVDNDGWVDIVVHPFHSGNKFRINPGPFNESTKPKGWYGTGVRLNYSIWLNNKGTLNTLSTELNVNGIYPGYLKGFFVNGKLKFFGFESKVTLETMNAFVMHVVTINFCNNLIKPLFNTTKYSICTSDSLKLTVTNINKGDTLKWYYGTKSDLTNISNKTFTDSTKLFVTRTDSVGCIISSDTIQLTKYNLPNKPTIAWGGIQFAATTTTTDVNYQWFLTNNSVSGATSATYKPAATGSYKIQITDANGCKNVSDSFSLVVTAVNPSIETSADHIAKIAPNPASTDVMLYFKQKPTKTLSIKLLNLNGQVLKQITTNSQSTRITLSDIIAGNYIIEIIGKGYNQTQQLLITK